MAWLYNTRTCELTHDGKFIGSGYSGTGRGRNTPGMENVPDVGPIPRGLYKIGDAYDHPHLGPCCMNLDPHEGTNTFDRDAFRIHGDNRRHDASHGCVILGPSIRLEIAKSLDKTLDVI